MATTGQVEAAFRRHVADDFVHHNPHFPPDRASLLQAMAQNALDAPGKRFDVRQVVASGDRVAVLSHVRDPLAGHEFAVVHVLRFHQGKIVEMWDVAQRIPADSQNPLGML